MKITITNQPPDEMQKFYQTGEMPATEELMPVVQRRLVLPLPGFTPGPWHVEYPLPGDTSYCAKAGCQMAVQAQTGPDVCWIRSFSEWTDMAKANARLIAAAPEMLEALKTLLAVSECADETGYVEDCGFVDIETVQQRARDAITQAVGSNWQNVRPLAPADNQTPNSNGQS